MIVKPFKNIACVARGRFCDKIAGTMLVNIHQIEYFATCCRCWGHVATLVIEFDFCHIAALRMSSCHGE